MNLKLNQVLDNGTIIILFSEYILNAAGGNDPKVTVTAAVAARKIVCLVMSIFHNPRVGLSCPLQEA